MKELIGKTINKITRPKGIDTLICFETSDGDFVYQTEGDCCSTSWFEHFEGIHNLIGHEISSVEEIDIGKVFLIGSYGPVDEYGEEHDCLQLYGIKLTTELGNSRIEFRNSSNGYYGGWVEFVGNNLRTDREDEVITEDY